RGRGRSYVFTKGEEVAAHHEAVLDAPGHLRTGRRLRRGERPESDEVGMTPMPTTTLRPRLPVSSSSDSTAIGGMTHQVDLPRGHGSPQRSKGIQTQTSAAVSELDRQARVDTGSTESFVGAESTAQGVIPALAEELVSSSLAEETICANGSAKNVNASPATH